MNRWRQHWQETDSNKLRKIKDSVLERGSSSHLVRRRETVLTKLRIGHTRLTHGHLMENVFPSYCEGCLVLLTVKHILT